MGRSLPFPLLTLLLLLIVGPSLASCGAPARPPSTTPTNSTSEDDDEEKSADDLRADLLELKREHEIAAAKHEGEALELAHELRSAEAKLKEADGDLKRFLKHELPNALKDIQLDLDRSKESAYRAQKELDELKAMYKAEEFANMTKELVLHRGTKDMEFAKRRLALSEAEATLKRDGELPKQQRELEQEVANAKEGVRVVNHKLSVLRMERALGLLKEKRAREKLEEELRDAKASDATSASSDEVRHEPSDDKANEPDDDVDK